MLERERDSVCTNLWIDFSIAGMERDGVQIMTAVQVYSKHNVLERRHDSFDSKDVSLLKGEGRRGGGDQNSEQINILRPDRP